MANYRVGDYIRLTRQHYGMSQLELALQADIATETISRIENGKHKISQTVYQKIMRVLNRFEERSYGICISKEVEVFDEKQKEEDAESKFEFEKAREHLDFLKKRVEDNIVNRQYVMRAETILDYNTGKIDVKTTIERLEDALKLTVDDYEKYLDCMDYEEKGYPFTEQEILILMNIGGAYAKNKDYKKDEKIMRMLLRCLDCSYIGGESVDNLKLVVQRNFACTLAGMDKYEEAIEILENTLEASRKGRKGLVTAAALYDITWDMTKINEMHGVPIYDWEEIKRKKRQAYYIAVARKEEHAREVIKNSYEKLFHETLGF